MEKETLEEVRVVKRTELYNSILSIVKQIPRKEVECDAMDAPSCTYELEQLFYKWQQERLYTKEDVREMLFEALNHDKTECCVTHTNDSIVRKVIKEYKKNKL